MGSSILRKPHLTRVAFLCQTGAAMDFWTIQRGRRVNPHTGIRTQIHFEGDQVVVKRPTTLNPICSALQKCAPAMRASAGAKAKRWEFCRPGSVTRFPISDDAERERATKQFFARTRRFSHTTHFSNELGPNKGRCGGVHPQDRFGRDDADIPGACRAAHLLRRIELAKVRCAAMRQSASMANGTRPAGFLEAIKIAESGSPDRPLEYRPLDKMPHERRAFSWDGATLVLSDDQAFPVDLTYYVRLAHANAGRGRELAHGQRTFDLSRIDAGRGASLAADDASAAREASNYASAVNALVSQEQSAAISGSALRIRARG